MVRVVGRTVSAQRNARTVPRRIVGGVVGIEHEFRLAPVTDAAGFVRCHGAPSLSNGRRSVRIAYHHFCHILPEDAPNVVAQGAVIVFGQLLKGDERF